MNKRLFALLLVPAMQLFALEFQGVKITDQATFTKAIQGNYAWDLDYGTAHGHKCGASGPAEAKYSSGNGFSANGRASVTAQFELPFVGSQDVSGYAEGNTADPTSLRFSLN